VTFSEQPPVYSRPKEAVPPTPLPYPAAAAGPYGGFPAVPPAQPPPPYPPATGYPPYPVSGGGGPSFRTPYPPAAGAGAAAYPGYATPYPPAPGASYQTQVSGNPSISVRGEICPFRFWPHLIEYDSFHCFDRRKYLPFFLSSNRYRYVSYLPLPNVSVPVPDLVPCLVFQSFSFRVLCIGTYGSQLHFWQVWYLGSGCISTFFSYQIRYLIVPVVRYLSLF
jgi:hypothetical protein